MFLLISMCRFIRVLGCGVGLTQFLTYLFFLVYC